MVKSNAQAAVAQASALMKVNSPRVRKSKTGKDMKVYEPLSPYNRLAYDWICDFLKTHHDQILLCKSKLELGECNPRAHQDKKQAARESPFFHATYQTFEKLPLYYIFDALEKVFKIPHAKVDAMDSYGGPTLRQAFEYLTGIGSNTPWWPALKLKKALIVFIKEMSADVLGSGRVAKLVAAIRGDGSVDWPSISPYRMHWRGNNNDRVVSVIEHESGAKVQMKRINIEEGTDAECMWSDRDCKFVDENDWSQGLMTLFPKSEAFRVRLSYPAMKTRAIAAKAAVEAESKEAEIGTSVLVTTKTKKRVDDMRAKKATQTPLKKMRTRLAA